MRQSLTLEVDKDQERVSMEFNLARVFKAIAGAIPERTALVYGDRSWTYAALDDTTDRFAAFLRGHGLGYVRAPRDELKPWESGQDHVGLVLWNCNQYLESMIGCYKARAAPFNVNYRYTVAELSELFMDARPKGVVFHTSFADSVLKALARVGLEDVLLVQVPEGDHESLVDGAVWYTDALSCGSDPPPIEEASGDDLNILFTGGTTGRPKGVLWRQADAFVTSLAGRRPDRSEYGSLDQVVERAIVGARPILPASPFMHGGGQVPAFQKWHRGGTVVLPSNTRHFDARDVLRTMSQWDVGETMIIGDAYALPLIDELRAHHAEYDLRALRSVFSGGAPLSTVSRRALLDLLPHVKIVDAMGSSESGPAGTSMVSAGQDQSAEDVRIFTPSPHSVILNDERNGILDPSSRDVGWLACSGRVALGYLNDEEKTKQSYPTIDGVRYLILGDLARHIGAGLVEFIGRNDSIINSGGEKVFAYEVEEVLKTHPSVLEAVVLGRPHPRWGQEVCAIVQLKPEARVAEDQLVSHCRSQLSGYKIPRTFTFVSNPKRTPIGKVDLGWARNLVLKGTELK